jgi:hypothetical protein
LQLYGKTDGWGGRIRTYDTRYQKPMPYHLATPQSVGRCNLATKFQAIKPVLCRMGVKNTTIRMIAQHQPVCAG